MKLLISLAISLLGVAALSSCVGKALTKPRSELIEEARDDGLEMRTVAEDRTLFFAAEEKNEGRLSALLQVRGRDQSSHSTYRIGSGDELEVDVFDVPELNLKVRVRDSGYISLPLVGDLRAGGRTEHELQQEIAGALRQYVKRPEVSLAVAEYSSQKVAVLGAVEKPGRYALRKGSNSILELISEAGGLSKSAGNYLSFIPVEVAGQMRNDFRYSSLSAQKGKQNDGIEIPLESVMGTAGNIPVEIPVRAGDFIVVSEAGKVMVEGEVQKGGAYDLGARMSLLGALAAAGGITYGAKVDEVEIVRPLATGDKARLVVDLGHVSRGSEQDVRLRNGDLVRVPSDSSRRLRQDTFEGITRIINFGVGGTMNMAN